MNQKGYHLQLKMVAEMRPKFRFLVFSVLLSIACGEKLSSEKNDSQSYGDLVKGVMSGISINSTILQEQFEVAKSMFQGANLNEVVSQISSLLKPLDGVSEQCLNDTLLVANGVRLQENWARQMIDAFGKPGSGILKAKTLWLGEFKECLDVNVVVGNTGPDNTTYATEPFITQYCVATHYLIPGFITPTAPSVQLGVCFPNSCSSMDIQHLLNGVISVVRPNMTAAVDTVTCQERYQRLERPAIITLCVVGLLAALVLIGTAYDVIYLQRRNSNMDKTKNSYAVNGGPEYPGTNQEAGTISLSVMTSEDPEPKEKSPNGDIIGNANGDINKGYVDGEDDALSKIEDLGQKVTPPVGDGMKYANATKLQRKEKYTPGVLGRLVVAFSVYTNGSKLLSTKQSSGSLRAVHGIRFISMTWVILGHTYFFGLGIYTNIATALPAVAKRWTFEAIDNASLSVDSFFLLSGLLVSYLALKEMKKVSGPRHFNWVMFYVHRYWRLTPPYMLIVLVYTNLFEFFGNGPLYPQQGYDANCPKNFWLNMLYLQNVVRSSEQCFGWAWYLANDMQFYAVSPLIFVPFYYSAKIGSVVAAIFLLASTVAPAVISSQNNLPSGISVAFTHPTGNFLGYVTEYYMKPWCRMGPYIIGLVTGYILYRTQCRIRMNKIVCLIGWVAAIAIGLAVIYGPHWAIYPDLMSVGMAALYNALHRTAWGVAVAWVVVACASGNGGFINTVLSWRAIIPLSRLTYCAYLIHPIVMLVYYFSRNTTFNVTDLNMIYSFFGQLVASYAIAVVASMLFEAPMMGIERAILHRRKKS